MPDTREIPSLMAQAAEAANANDPAAAVALLREVLDQQTATLGAEHKELAPTLNNLAMMLERQGDVAEAERCYRHAYDIARRGAAPNDPLVQVSRANLNAFLQASGRIDTADSGPWGELDDFAADGEHLSSARDHRVVPAAHSAERIEYFDR